MAAKQSENTGTVAGLVDFILRNMILYNSSGRIPNRIMDADRNTGKIPDSRTPDGQNVKQILTSRTPEERSVK
jgi:hypothetical protein